MVSTFNIVALFINIVLCFSIPIGIIINFIIKKQSFLRPLLFGAITFIVSQIIVRIPVSQSFASIFPDTKNMSNWQYIVFLVITAAIFEEVGKYIGLKIGITKKPNFNDGVAFGVGFAGLSSILFSGVSYISNLSVAFFINSNGIEEFLKAFSYDKDTVAKVSSSLIDVNWFEIVSNGLHDVFWLAIEIALTLIIVYGLKFGFKKSLVYLLLASSSHIFMEGLVSVMGIYFNLSRTTSEIYFGILGLIAISFIVITKKRQLIEK